MLDYVNDYDYEADDLETDIFLSEVPVELLKTNIENQFKTLDNRKKDHVNLFFNMLDFSVKYTYDNNPDPEEEIGFLEDARDDFFLFMLDIFDRYLGIGIEGFDDLSITERRKLIHYIYRFFLNNMKKNFINFIINYINENKDLYKDETLKKDITTISSKKYITDVVDIVVLSKLNSIIDSIIYDDIDIDDFFAACKKSDETLELLYIMKKYDDFTITGNFIPKYVEMIDESFKTDLETKIRSKILKKYKIRKKEIIKIQENIEAETDEE